MRPTNLFPLYRASSIKKLRFPRRGQSARFVEQTSVIRGYFVGFFLLRNLEETRGKRGIFPEIELAGRPLETANRIFPPLPSKQRHGR